MRLRPQRDDFRTRLLVVLLAEVEQNKPSNERSAVDHPTRQFRSAAPGDRKIDVARGTGVIALDMVDGQRSRVDLLPVRRPRKRRIIGRISLLTYSND